LFPSYNNAVAAPQANGMTYNSHTSSYVSSGATYVWVDDPEDMYDEADPRYARHDLSYTAGALNAGGTTGVARARADFHYTTGADYALLEKTNNTTTGSYTISSPITQTKSSSTYPMFNAMDGKYYLYLTTDSFHIENSCIVTPESQPHTLTASVGTSGMATVTLSVRPNP
jgi:hypothetical protein